MRLPFLRRHWEELGRTDPFWAVLADPDKRGNKWQVDEFFKTGRQEVQALLEYLHASRIDVPRGGVLDFGCGAGRVSQAFADHFESVVGVDIAGSMIEVANRHNRHPSRCTFVLNDANHLHRFPSGQFVFVYSNIVLQHMRPRYIRAYLCEFARVLAPSGLLVFQLPGVPPEFPVVGGYLKRHLPMPVVKKYRELKRWRYCGFPRMDINGMDPGEVTGILGRQGLLLLDRQPDRSHGDAWPGYRYCFRRP